jgi:hypothetical protein
MDCDIDAGWLLSSFSVGVMFGAFVGLSIATLFARRPSNWGFTSEDDDWGLPDTRSSIPLQPTLRSLRDQASGPNSEREQGIKI